MAVRTFDLDVPSKTWKSKVVVVYEEQKPMNETKSVDVVISAVSEVLSGKGVARVVHPVKGHYIIVLNVAELQPPPEEIGVVGWPIDLTAAGLSANPVDSGYMPYPQDSPDVLTINVFLKMASGAGPNPVVVDSAFHLRVSSWVDPGS